MNASDGIGIASGHRLDLHAALNRQHPQVLTGRPVEREAGVVLLGDVGGLLDPEAVHDVARDVEAQDVGRAPEHLVGVRGQLHATGLAPASGVDLGLHHHRQPEPLGRGHRLVRRERHLAQRNRQSAPGEQLLALMLEQIHERRY